MPKNKFTGWSGVVKLQWPVTSNTPNPECMIYSEDRFVMALAPADETIRALMQGRLKTYHNATISPEGKLELGDMVEDQPW